MLVDTKISERGLRLRASAKEVVAAAMVENRDFCREAWVAAGFAVEFALKALICRREGWSYWPTGKHRPDLHVHTLKALFGHAKIDLRSDVPRNVQPSVRQVLNWERRHDYVEDTMSRQNARSMYQAAFDKDGVVLWLNNL